MKIKKTETKGITIITVSERMDSITSPEMERCLWDTLHEHPLGVILDLSGLTYISSAGLRVILAAAKKLKEGGGQLVLSGLDGPVKEVIRLAGFHSFLPIFDTWAQALDRQ